MRSAVGQEDAPVPFPSAQSACTAPRTVKLTFPQTDRSATFTFSVRECEERKPFNLCLTLSSNPWGGPTAYYGFSRPEDERAALGALARDVDPWRR